MKNVTYIDACENCRENPVQGCDNHSGQPRLLGQGNPTKTSLVIDTLSYVKKFLQQHHKVDGSHHISPKEFRLLRDFCVSSNSPFYFAILTLLLVSIELFLRTSEFSSLDDEAFNPLAFVMVGEYMVKGIKLKVQVKGTRQGGDGM